eukprot:9477115-Pyramimonas_sp.AAC.1
MDSLSKKYADIAQNFVYDPRITPLCERHVVLYTSIGYVTAMLLLQELRRGKPALNLGVLPKVHNLILCLGSLLMFLGALYEAYVEYQTTDSTRFLFCLPVGFKVKGALYFWSYIYYLSKYYELLDTVILVLRGKGLNFLHVFHHAFVILMAYLWLECAQSLQTIALLTNTFIHVIMYSYYFLVSCGYKPPWKKLITKGQIVQFVFSFICLGPFAFYHREAGCSGAGALLFNASFNLALIVLFGNFFKKSYSKDPKANTKKVQ